MKQRWENKLPTNPKKIVLAFVFREISWIVYNFSFCCELQRCRELPTWIFLLWFSTNRHIWRIVRLSCKFQKFLNFANSDFSVFLHDSGYFVTFGTILRISKICKFVKRGFFPYFLTNCTFGNFWDDFANFENFERQTWIFLYFLTNWHTKRRLRPLCKFPKFATISKFFFQRNFCSSSFIRFCSFGRSKLLQTWIF